MTFGWGHTWAIFGGSLLIVSVGFAQSGETTPLGRESLDLGSELLRIGGFLIVLVAVALITVRLNKKLAGRVGSGPLKVLDGKNLAPGVGVRLIKVGSRAWLVGVTKEQVSLLAEVPLSELELEKPTESSQ